MAGRFEGVRDLEWRWFADVFPPGPPKRGRGLPHAPFRNILHTLLSVLIPGCRWGDVPRGLQGASKRAPQRWLPRWQAEGTLAALPARMLGGAEEKGMMRWESGGVAGAFSPWHGGRRGRRPRGAGQGDPAPPPHRGERDAVGELHDARQRG
jgi:transposase